MRINDRSQANPYVLRLRFRHFDFRHELRRVDDAREIGPRCDLLAHVDGYDLKDAVYARTYAERVDFARFQVHEGTSLIHLRLPLGETGAFRFAAVRELLLGDPVPHGELLGVEL